jgi:hypothetical protein
VKAGGKQSLLLGLFFYPEDGGDIFTLNIGCLPTDYTALYSRRYNKILQNLNRQKLG